MSKRKLVCVRMTSTRKQMGTGRTTEGVFRKRVDNKRCPVREMPLFKIIIVFLCFIGSWALILSQGKAQDFFPTSGSNRSIEFEVATIKPIDHNGRQRLGFFGYPGGRVFFGATTVQMLIQYAFDVEEFQISGGPNWITTDRYNVEAIDPTMRNSDNAPTRATPTGTQRQMLQALLIDRFGLKFHRTTKNGSVLLLVRGDGKLNLDDAKDKTRDPRGGVFMKPDGTSDGQAMGVNVTMNFLAKQLSQELGRIVINQTGLQEAYDFHIEPSEPSQDYTNAIFNAMQRLGLKLKTGKGPIEAIVIDQVDRPTEN